MKKVLALALAFIICFSMLSSIPVFADTEYEAFYTWGGTADGWTISEATTYGTDPDNSWAFTATGNGFVAGNSSYKHITRAYYNSAVTESVYEVQYSMTGFGRDTTGNKIPEAVTYLNRVNDNHYYKLSVAHETGTSGYNRVLILRRYYGWNNSIGNFDIAELGRYTLAENIALTEEFSVKLAANVDRSGTNTAIKVYLFDDSNTKNLVIDALDTNGVLADGKLGFEAYANTSLSVEDIIFLRPKSNLPDPVTAVYSLNGNSANWNLSGGAVFNDDITGIQNSWANTDLNMSAVYRGHLLSGNYEIGVKSNAGGNANGNVNYIYFNYADSLNYYCITQGSYNAGTAGATAPVMLGKYVGGEYEEIASYVAAHSSKTYAFNIKQENGFISVSYVSGTTTHTPFTNIAVDDKLNSGFVGFGTKNNMGAFTELTLSGDVTDVSLKLEQSSIEDGAEDIPLSDCSVALDFNYDLLSDTVDTLGVYLREKESGNLLSEDLYSIDYKLTNPKHIDLNISGPLDVKTVYEIVISKHLLSKDYGSAVSSDETVISFTTVPPEFDVNARLYQGGQNVTDISSFAGQTVSFTVSLENSGSAPQPYIASVCLFDGNNMLLTGKYFSGTVAADFTDNTTVCGELAIPSNITENAKAVIFIWDGLTNMNILYPCIEI